jgi:hypothetical protein
MSIIDTFDATSEKSYAGFDDRSGAGFPETVVITFHDRTIDALKALYRWNSSASFMRIHHTDL